MKKSLFTLLTVNLILAFSFVNAQGEANDSSLNSESKTVFKPFVSLSIFPMIPFIYGQTSVGFEVEKSKFKSSIYLKAGAAIESVYYSAFLESNYRFKTYSFENNRRLEFQIPIWFAYRNYLPLARGEEHYPSASFTLLNLGTGLNIKFDLGKRISFIHKVGVGVGPKYIRAGNFRYKNFEYQKITAFPNLDLGVVLWLNN